MQHCRHQQYLQEQQENKECVWVCSCTWAQGRVRQPREVTSLRFSQTSETTVSHHPTPSRSSSLFSNSVGGPWMQHAQVQWQTELTCSQTVWRRCTACRRARTWLLFLRGAERRHSKETPEIRFIYWLNVQLLSGMTEDCRPLRHTCTRITCHPSWFVSSLKDGERHAVQHTNL